MELEDFETVPVEDIITPKDGRIVYANRYWVVTKDNEILFYTKMGARSPQCNYNKQLVEKLCPDGCHVEFLPLAFL